MTFQTHKVVLHRLSIDQPKADLLTQRLEVHEKNAWMLRCVLTE